MAFSSDHGQYPSGGAFLDDHNTIPSSLEDPVSLLAGTPFTIPQNEFDIFLADMAFAHSAFSVACVDDLIEDWHNHSKFETEWNDCRF